MNLFVYLFEGGFLSMATAAGLGLLLMLAYLTSLCFTD